MNNIIMSGSSFKLRELISSKKWSMSTKNASSILHIIATKHNIQYYAQSARFFAKTLILIHTREEKVIDFKLNVNEK